MEAALTHRDARDLDASARGRCYESVLDAIGSTPLVRLGRLFADHRFRVFAKMEGWNPGGSAKDRAALSMIRRAIECGRVRATTTVIESSSGNMAIGLALACKYLGLRLICVVDAKTTSQHLALLNAYGAEIHQITRPDPTTGELLPARLAYVHRLLDEIPDSFWTNQYANPHNALAHRETMREIHQAVDGSVDYLFCATSTCGTLRGCAEYIASAGLTTRLVAVDAVGSRIFADAHSCARLIPGLGAGICPELCRDIAVHLTVHVSDLDCVVGCRRLIRDEAILAGGSSGGVVTAVLRMADELPAGSGVVVILPDRGERYLDTVYTDAWVSRTFGSAVALESEEATR